MPVAQRNMWLQRSVSESLANVLVPMEGPPTIHLGMVLSNDLDQLSPDSPKENDGICMIFVLRCFPLGR